MCDAGVCVYVQRLVCHCYNLGVLREGGGGVSAI